MSIFEGFAFLLDSSLFPTYFIGSEANQSYRQQLGGETALWYDNLSSSYQIEVRWL